MRGRLQREASDRPRETSGPGSDAQGAEGSCARRGLELLESPARSWGAFGGEQGLWCLLPQDPSGYWGVPSLVWWASEVRTSVQASALGPGLM